MALDGGPSLEQGGADDDAPIGDDADNDLGEPVTRYEPWAQTKPPAAARSARKWRNMAPTCVEEHKS